LSAPVKVHVHALLIDERHVRVTAPGVVPNGTLLKANGGEKEFEIYLGEVWFRAAQETQIEVQR
jgi:hypothetical protein